VTNLPISVVCKSQTCVANVYAEGVFPERPAARARGAGVTSEEGGDGAAHHHRASRAPGMAVARTGVMPVHAMAAARRHDAALASLPTNTSLHAELAHAKRFLRDNYWEDRENLVYEFSDLADFIGAGMTAQQCEQYPERPAGVSAVVPGTDALARGRITRISDCSAPCTLAFVVARAILVLPDACIWAVIAPSARQSRRLDVQR
jgi:hypothetical protein